MDDWTDRALDDSALIAHAVLSFRRATAPSTPPIGLPPAWGCCVRCPRRGRPRRISDSKVSVASGRRIGNRKDAVASRRRIGDIMDAAASRPWPSPMTPLEYRGGSGASQSGSEGIEAERSSTKGPAGGAGRQRKMVVDGERESSIFRIPKPKAIRRPSTQKKPTLQELLAMHQSLLEHRGFLQNELEAQRRTKATLVAKNQELKRRKLRLEFKKQSSTALLVSEEAHPKRLRLCDSFVPLPDLNIPLVGECPWH